MSLKKKSAALPRTSLAGRAQEERFRVSQFGRELVDLEADIVDAQALVDHLVATRAHPAVRHRAVTALRALRSRHGHVQVYLLNIARQPTTRVWRSPSNRPAAFLLAA